MLVSWGYLSLDFFLSFSNKQFVEGRGISYLFAGLYCAGARTAAVTQVAVSWKDVNGWGIFIQWLFPGSLNRWDR